MTQLREFLMLKLLKLCGFTSATVSSCLDPLICLYSLFVFLFSLARRLFSSSSTLHGVLINNVFLKSYMFPCPLARDSINPPLGGALMSAQRFPIVFPCAQ
jgi:hypothetical protein